MLPLTCHAMQILRAGKQGYSTFSVLAAGLGSVPSRLVLACNGAVKCFPEKAGAMRTGTAQSMLIKHQTTCVTPLAVLIERLERRGTFLPWCGEFESHIEPTSAVGNWIV